VVEGAWYPRGGGFSDAELAAEQQKAQSFPLPAGYNGVRYTGPACVNQTWLQQLAEQQKNGVLLPKGDAYLLVIDAIKALKQEKTLNVIDVPVGQKITVCGDIHGQYWDFLNIFALNGFPSESNPYLFNGDFVDRGSWGIEVILMIFAFKVMAPKHIHLSRGNHELIEANLIYGFCGECFKKYDGQIFDLFSEAFRSLSLCHVINKQVFVTHGGLPGPNPRQWLPGQSHDPEDAIPTNAPDLVSTLDKIAAIDRETELQSQSYKDAVNDPRDKWDEETRMIIDLVWGDPRGGVGYGPSYRKSKGIFMFGPDVTEQFCQVNNLKCVIRSHEVKQLGWKQDHPQLYTVFSAPDYMDTGGNQGAYITVENVGGNCVVKPNSFNKTPHPDLKPMVWQEYMMQVNPHLTKKMKKKTGIIYDSNGMIVGEIKDQDQGDSDSAQGGISEEWVEDDAYA
jgi:serine/threonine-protein phosphatase 5